MTAGLPSSVTVLATRTVRDGYQTEFETFLHQPQDVFAAAPGHLGLTVIRPRTPDREHALVYRSTARTRCWPGSAPRSEPRPSPVPPS
jgi:antibiotic biosynthesis monooxygenase (ABM) superfamily enzyme